MIVVRVELWSAITGKKTELARMHITNDASGNLTWRNYIVQTFKGRSKEQLDKLSIQRTAGVLNFPSPRVHVWNLVRKSLTQLGYTDAQ